MHPLSAQQIVRTWELGQGQHPLDRALSLLACGCPEKTPTELAAMTIGQRDAHLLTLRELTFGTQLNSFAECPQCGERLESSFRVADIRIAELEQSPAQVYALTVDDYALQFRLPNSWDLAAIVPYRNVQAASEQLRQRCLLQASYQGTAIAYTELPPGVLQQLAAQMTECDPQAEILLNFTCPACSHDWQLLFDILAFFWTELSAQAKRLLQEVHVLARFYGWREADILAMSTTRRQFYLGLVG